MNSDTLRIRAAGPLRGRVRVPGDKSISHRALIFNGFSAGHARIEGLLQADDVRSTARCLGELGVHMDAGQVLGCGGQLQGPEGVLDCGNSGTTIRLLLGVLAGQSFSATLTGDESLCKRPMARVIDPLTLLGARFTSAGGVPPVTVRGGPLCCQSLRSSVASAQVKSAVLLAALQGEGSLHYTEPRLSRDHTERMFAAMGVEMERHVDDNGEHSISMAGVQGLEAADVVVPGDISSAAFLMVAASIVEGSVLTLEGVGLNPTRTGILDVLAQMGGSVEVVEATTSSGEELGTLKVRASSLQGTVIGGSLIPRLIDEIPVIAVAAALAEGETRIEDAQELRVKESDRISATVGFLRSMGVDADETPDGMVIEGLGAGGSFGPARVEAGGDHRIAMAAAVAGLRGRGETWVGGAHAIQTSFPDFPRLLETLRD